VSEADLFRQYAKARRPVTNNLVYDQSIRRRRQTAALIVR
jgi:hypothetical protein